MSRLWGIPVNVGENCLIVTGGETGNSEAPAGSRSIDFLGNTCATGGAQAVNLHHWPNADVRKNKFFGRNIKRGILITNGSAGCTARDNTTASGVPAVEIGDSSRPGFNDPF